MRLRQLEGGLCSKSMCDMDDCYRRQWLLCAMHAATATGEGSPTSTAWAAKHTEVSAQVAEGVGVSKEEGEELVSAQTTHYKLPHTWWVWVTRCAAAIWRICCCCCCWWERYQISPLSLARGRAYTHTPPAARQPPSQRRLTTTPYYDHYSHVKYRRAVKLWRQRRRGTYLPEMLMRAHMFMR